MSVEEYLAWDDRTEARADYHDGEVFEPEASSLPHGVLLANLAGCLTSRLRRSGCVVSINGPRVQVASRKFVYPDVLVFCGRPAPVAGQPDTVTDAKWIAEVLSPSTLDYDYGTKFALYRKLPSLLEYVLVSQSDRTVEVFRRNEAGQWVLSTYEGRDAAFESLGVSVPLDEIYGGVL